MKVSSLFNLVTDAKDVLDFFDGVDTPEQMVSALERAKHDRNASDLLDCLASLRASISEALADTLEMSAVLDDDDADDADDVLEAELAKITAETAREDPIVEGESTNADPKNGVQG